MDLQKLFPVPFDWLSETDRALAQTVARWAEKDLNKKRIEVGEKVSPVLKNAARSIFTDVALQYLVWPEDHGGVNLDSHDAAMTCAVVLEQAAIGDAGIAFLLANNFAIQWAVGIGSNRNEEALDAIAKDNFAGDEPLLCGLIWSDYATDPDAPSEKGGLYPQAKASFDDDRIIVNAKDCRPQCAGANGRLFGLFSYDEKHVPCLVLVPSTTKGVRVGEPIQKTGLDADINADVSFESVELPASAKVCSGEKRMRGLEAFYRTCLCAVMAGSAAACWHILDQWGKTRVIKGKGNVFKDNALTAELMGRIAQKIILCRTMTFQAARFISRPDIYGNAGDDTTHAFCLAAFQTVGGAVGDAIHGTMELMASAGYATEWQLERYWRDVRTIRSLAGPTIVDMTRIASHVFESRIERE